MMNPYEVLGVREGADMNEIKAAYRRKAKEYHPDLHPEDPRANEKMQRVNEAYEMLCNPDKYRAQQTPNPDPYADFARRGYAGQEQRYNSGTWQYTYYYSNANEQPFEQDWDDDWRSAYEEERQRRSAFVVRPMRGVLRFVAGILLLRFLLSLLRLGLFGFFI